MIFTKLYIPQIDERVVHRTTLFKKLDEGIKRKLIIVSATAGYGKTTLISDWLRQKNLATAWCSIDARDNDPLEFLKIVITAVNNKHNTIGKSSLELLKSPGTASVEYIIELFINDLLSLKNEIVLVLDDFHLINNKQVVGILSTLIEYKPSFLKLIISTRSDPSIALARLRSQNEILEIRSADLSFSKFDIFILFNKKLKLGLTEKDLITLEQKTEGWIAGLQLTALTIQGNKDKSEYIEKMAGDNRYIMDYLLEEVLDNQNEEMNKFLLFTSVLEKFSASLCDTLLKTKSSQAILESLEKSNMFLIPLDNDRKWYRYHHLFGDLLKNRLAITYKDKIPELHHKASLWFEENKLPEFAIMHSLIGANTKRALKLLDPIIETINESLEYYRIFKYGSIFKEEEIIGNKNICVTYAWTLALTGNLKGAKHYLEKLQKQLSSSNPKDDEITGKVNLTYSSIFISEGDTKMAFEYSEKALKHLSKKNNSWNVWARIIHADAYLLRFELEECIKSYSTALDISRKSNNSYLLLATVSKNAHALMLNGQYQESSRMCLELMETYTSNPDIDKNKFAVATSILYSIVGLIQIEQNVLEKGFENASKGYRYSQKSVSVTFRGYCAYNFAVSCFKLGKIDQAFSVINELETMLKKDISIGINNMAYSFRNKLLIEKEETEKLDLPKKISFEKNRNNIFEYYFVNLVIARKLVYNDAYNNAINLLNELTASLKNNEVFELLIEAELLKAKVLANLKQKDDAIKSLSNAIQYSQSESLIRIFITEGEEINQLLKELMKQKSIKTSKSLDSISKKYLNSLLQAFDSEKNRGGFDTEEDLSNRELEILKLIAEELTNQEIADKLFISLNTVKTHVKNILMKLEAANRSKAVEKAKKKGVLLS